MSIPTVLGKVFNTRLLTAAVIASTGLLAACGPSGTSNTSDKGQTTLNVQGTTPSGTTARLMARTSDPAPVSIDVYDASGKSGIVQLTQALMVIKEIDLEYENEVEDDSGTSVEEAFEVEYVGPFVVNLLTSTSNPSFPSLLVKTGSYTDLEVDIEKLSVNDLDAYGNPLTDTYPQLDGYSLYLKGTYTSTDETYKDIPFELKYDQTDEFDLSTNGSTAGFNIDGDTATNLVIAFRMAKWFRFDDPDTSDDGITLEQAIIDGAIFLDAKNNPDVMDVIEDNIEDSADYGEDKDDDGELDSNG